MAEAGTEPAAATVTCGARLAPGDLISAALTTYVRGFFLFTTVTGVTLSPYLVWRWVEFRLETQAAFHYQVLIYLLQCVAIAAVIYGVFRRQKGQPAEIWRCFAIAFARVLPLIGVALIILLGAVAMMILPTMLAALAGPVATVFAAGVVFGLVWSALSPAMAVVVVERRGVFAALGRSCQLVQKDLWRVFAVWFVVTAFPALLAWLTSEASWQFRETFDPDTLVAIRLTLECITSVVFAGVQAVAVGLIYYRLRQSVDGADEDELAAVFA